MAWTDEQREAAIRLWRASKSAAFIADELGPSIMRGPACAGLSLARAAPRPQKRQRLESGVIVAVSFLASTSPHRRLAKFVARTVGWPQSRIEQAMRFFFCRQRALSASPKPNTLAPTFRFRAWTLADLPGARRAPSKSPHGAIGLSSSARSESESGYRTRVIVKRSEKSEQMMRPLIGEGPMSLRVAIRACRRAQALRAEAGQAAQQFEQGVKSAR